MSINPVDQPGFNRRVYRPPNQETMRALRSKSTTWRATRNLARDMKSEVDNMIVEAFDQGHSYAQLREATGLGNGAIETIIAKAGRRAR